MFEKRSGIDGSRRNKAAGCFLRPVLHFSRWRPQTTKGATTRQGHEYSTEVLHLLKQHGEAEFYSCRSYNCLYTYIYLPFSFFTFSSAKRDFDQFFDQLIVLSFPLQVNCNDPRNALRIKSSFAIEMIIITREYLSLRC